MRGFNGGGGAVPKALAAGACDISHSSGPENEPVNVLEDVLEDAPAVSENEDSENEEIFYEPNEPWDFS